MGSVAGFQQYDNSVRDLVRFLINVIQHYKSMGQNSRVKVIITNYAQEHEFQDMETVLVSWINHKIYFFWICLFEEGIGL